MKIMATVLALSSTLALAASGPRYAVEDLYKAAKKTKNAEFLSLLTAAAREQIGHPEGMAAVKAEGEAHKYDFKMEKTLVHEAPGSGTIYSVRTYEVFVESDKTKQLLRRPLVECPTYNVRHPGRCFEECWGSSPWGRHCHWRCERDFYTIEENNCRVSDWNR